MSETGIEVSRPVRAITRVTVEAIEFNPPCWIPENWKDFTEGLFFSNGVYYTAFGVIQPGDWVVRYGPSDYRIEKSSVFLGSTAYQLLEEDLK